MPDANTLTAIFTGVIAALTLLVWRSYKRVEWLTGALESHSTLMARMEARKTNGPDGQPMPLVWWDPDEEKPPMPKHGDDATVKMIRVYLPPKQRKGWREGGCLKRAWRWWNAEI